MRSIHVRLVGGERRCLPSRVSRSRAIVLAPSAASPSTKTSQLAQLAKRTVLSIDTGDLSIIKKWASTGLITDATTNPLFVSQAAARGNEPEYAALVDAAVAAAKLGHSGKYAPVAPHLSGKALQAAQVNLAIDHLRVNLGRQILALVPAEPLQDQ